MPGFRSVANLLIYRVVALAIACMLVFGGVHAWLEYRHSQWRFAQAMDSLAQNSLVLLSNALWDIDPAIVHSQLEALAGLAEVAHVRVRAQTTGQMFEAGTGSGGRAPAVSLQIDPPQGLAGQGLGVLEVWEDRGHYWALLWRSTGHLLLGYALFTGLVCAMVAWVMRKELRDPLRQIASFAESLQPDELSRPLVLQRPARSSIDEIDLVAQGFGRLQHDLQGYIGHLDMLVAQRTAQLQSLVEEVKRLSLTDALTGCYNRRALDERLQAQMETCRSQQQPLCVLFVDVDWFKRVNDAHGHAAGDAVLRAVAARCQQQLRASLDWMVRYGGEEFLIVLPGLQTDEANALAHGLAAAIREQPVCFAHLQLSVTASFGVAQMQMNDQADSLLARADAMLYAAKSSGRDCVRVAGMQEAAGCGAASDPGPAAVTDVDRDLPGTAASLALDPGGARAVLSQTP